MHAGLGRHATAEDELLVAPRASLALLLLVLGAGAASAQDGGRPERGDAFVRANCAACHAVGRTGGSPLAAAPPFRDLDRRYPAEQLAEAFAEGITTGHPGMPEFALSEAQIADLLAYLRSLRR